MCARARPRNQFSGGRRSFNNPNDDNRLRLLAEMWRDPLHLLKSRIESHRQSTAHHHSYYRKSFSSSMIVKMFFSKMRKVMSSPPDRISLSSS